MTDGTGRAFLGRRAAAAARSWIACRLRFRDWRRRPLLQAGRFTELFFLDEATAFAAGPRPCALCRVELLRWTPAGYTPGRRRPTSEDALLVKPTSLVAILRADWHPVVPLLHPSALAAGAR